MHRISISSWHRNGRIVPAFVTYHFMHCILHKSFHHHASASNMFFAYHLFSCLLMHDPWIFLCKTKTKRKHENSCCIRSCICLVPWANHVGIINPLHLKTKWLNMVPNACLTMKRCFFGHLNFIITFVMHSLSMLKSFISVKCCQTIGNRNCHSLYYRVEPSSCFYEKGSSSQVKGSFGPLLLGNGAKFDRGCTWIK